MEATGHLLTWMPEWVEWNKSHSLGRHTNCFLDGMGKEHFKSSIKKKARREQSRREREKKKLEKERGKGRKRRPEDERVG